MPESTATSSAQTAAPGSPTTTGKGGGGSLPKSEWPGATTSRLPRSEYPFVPQWLSQAAPQASRGVTPALNPGQGAGRFISQPPAAAPQGVGGIMGNTITATPVVRATQAGTTFRPTVTPSIYDEWKNYNAQAQQTMEGQGGDLSAIVPSGIYKGFTVAEAMKFHNYAVLHPEIQVLDQGGPGSGASSGSGGY